MSDKTSCISHPPKSIFVMIRIDYMAICQGSPDAACSAALLSYFENWMNTKLDNRPQAKIRNKIDQDGGKAATQDESLWVYISQDDLKKDLLGVFGDTKINACLQWLRNVGYLSCRENPEHRWDRKLQYMLNIETVQTLLNDVASHGEFNIKLSKASKKPIKSVKKDAREDENNEAIAKNVLDSELDSEIDIKDSSALRSEDAPIIPGAEIQVDPLPSPELVQAIEENSPEDESAPQQASPENFALPIVIELDEAVEVIEESSEAIAAEAEQSDPDPITPEELEVVGNSDVVRKAEEFVEEVTKPKKLNPLKEAVRRVVSAADELVDADSTYVQLWIGFFCGTLKKTPMKEYKQYQLTDTPMTDAQIAGMLLWHRSSPKYNWQKSMNTTPKAMRAYCDEFLALPSLEKWVAEGKKRLDQIMSSASSTEDKPKIESRVANAVRPPDESDMEHFDIDEFERSLA
jgi:hypothetical protein